MEILYVLLSSVIIVGFTSLLSVYYIGKNDKYIWLIL